MLLREGEGFSLRPGGGGAGSRFRLNARGFELSGRGRGRRGKREISRDDYGLVDFGEEG